MSYILFGIIVYLSVSILIPIIWSYQGKTTDDLHEMLEDNNALLTLMTMLLPGMFVGTLVIRLIDYLTEKFK